VVILVNLIDDSLVVAVDVDAVLYRKRDREETKVMLEKAKSSVYAVCFG